MTFALLNNVKVNPVKNMRKADNFEDKVIEIIQIGSLDDILNNWTLDQPGGYYEKFS